MKCQLTEDTYMTAATGSNQNEDTEISQSEGRSTSRRNPRVHLTETERATVATLLRQSRDEAERRAAELSDVRAIEAKRALNAATQELFGRNPDFRETAQKLADQIKPDLYKLKPLGGDFGGVNRESVSQLSCFTEILEERERLRLLGETRQGPTFTEIMAERERLRLLGITMQGSSICQNPPFVGELWWGETNSFSNGPDLVVDIDADPPRIWGHIAYNSDQLLKGNIGFSMFFFLTPDRFPACISDGRFEIRPRVQISGLASGWTGLYHPILHADDKWSKCWQTLRMSATLSSGEPLDSSELGFNLFFLEDESPVGQANISLTMGWVPILRFGANLSDLRARGVSIVLEAAFRYDYQLVGESDLWLRNRPGSNAESVAGFDNAVRFRMFPGSVLVV
jgi:hypothetical protein